MPDSQALELSFINNYSALLIRVWTSEAEAAKLAEDPAQFARQMGLPVGPTALVRLDTTPPSDGIFHKEEIIADWFATPDVHVLHVPATPVVDVDELMDADLDVVSAACSNNIIIPA
ncbi:MAG: hypothetical protein JWM19_3888 [Actinomycetia bacterium]|nr:hypothetical protein [Actinomycetes bacterium]